MRCIFEEEDVICAEVVRDFQHDGLYLQARSQKYGKLSSGQLLTVAPYLVKRQNQHFHHLEHYGIDLILGCNGFIWVGEHVEARDDMIEDQINQSDPQTSEYICRAADAVRALSTLGFILTLEIIKGVIDLSLSTNLDIHDMLGSEFCVLVAEKEAERRSSNKNL
uniref:Nucleic acid-binding, OB-fold, putative n=1 Tax=Medicago truncatula TaxID=3880 RepID=A2Q2J1_MEDTR|nr:Nucleic acid-binding, OB-fold, putative [Medicago truncatula]